MKNRRRKTRSLTAGTHRVVDEEPGAPALSGLHDGKVPLRGRGAALGKQDDDAAQQEDLGAKGQEPEKHAVEPARVHEAVEQQDGGEFRKGKGHDARDEAEHCILDGVLLLLDVERRKVPAVAPLHGLDREADARPGEEEGGDDYPVVGLDVPHDVPAHEDAGDDEGGADPRDGADGRQDVWPFVGRQLCRS